MTERLVWIDWKSGRSSPCFWIRVVDGVVVEAPPIARWTRGKKLGLVVGWYRARGARVDV